MSNFSKEELDLFSNKILDSYDNQDPGVIFKKKN